MANAILSDETVMNTLSAVSDNKRPGQAVDPPGFHPFPAKMPVALAEFLIQNLTTSEAKILDPMLGSGTSLVAAKRLGRHGIGFDRDPLAVMISRCANHSYDSTELKELGTRVLERAKVFLGRDEYRLPTVRKRFPKEKRDFIRYWFPWRSQKQLFALADAISHEPEGPERNFAWLLFSSLIISKSSGASYAMDISRSRPHKRPDKLVTLPFNGWNKRLVLARTRLPFVDKHHYADIEIQRGDARHLPVGKDVADFILTSPPYLNAIDYIRSHKFSLIWMGYNMENLRELRGTMVGAERGLRGLDGIPSYLESLLDSRIRDDHKRAVVRKYLSDMRKVLSEIVRVLKPNGIAIFVVGPYIINKRRTDAYEVISSISESVGLKTVGAVSRNICSSRRSLPPPSAFEHNPLSKRMRKELILAFRK